MVAIEITGATLKYLRSICKYRDTINIEEMYDMWKENQHYRPTIYIDSYLNYTGWDHYCDIRVNKHLKLFHW